MTTIYRVSSAEQLHFSDPLHVGRFYPHTQRRHPRLMQDRQDLILYLAGIHSVAARTGKPRGFCKIPMRLMTLREWVYDYKQVFDYFFEITDIGYNLGDKKCEISYVIPKILDADVHTLDSSASPRKLLYSVPPRVDVGAISKVFVQKQNAESIRAKLLVSGRLDLHAAVEWLLTQSELNFHFIRSGKLQLRDTSVWPVAAIETWPSWLREELFGPGIDIESAYTQFLIEHIREGYNDRPHMVKMLYPDLVRSLEDKKNWRREICVDVLGLTYNDVNVGIVKQICMSLANGSKISPAILTGDMSFSMTRDIILQNIENASLSNLTRIGRRLATISKQYAQARKLVCTLEIGLNATRKNQKKVFATYFDWEREARYEIWNAVDRHGIMVHDGIDGIPEKYLADIPGLVKSLNLRLTRS